MLNCIDYRLTGATERYMSGRGMAGKYDQIVLAGAALGAKTDKFPAWGTTFWEHVQVAIDLHNIHKVVVMDHRDCGAYKVAFGKEFAAEHDAETAQHKSMMVQLKAALAKKHPELASEFYLMALDGTAEKIV